MKLYIKHMVSARCKMVVKEELNKLGLHYVVLELGLVDVMEDLTEAQRNKLKNGLSKAGFELMDDRKAILVEKTKTAIIELVHHSETLPKVVHSDYLSRKVGYDYTYLANLFSEVKGITIQQFIINHKIEKVKELLLYGELSLKEISYQLDYSSVAHLSNQFKKTTGLCPSFYKQMQHNRRTNLECV
jgi:AraC-like DNA-binding protein